jgi:excinuclease ABC subunit C
MAKAAEARDYERAAELRDVIAALRRTTERTRKFTYSSILQMEATRADGGAAGGPRAGDPATETMECFDISHISGSFCVASMVRFVGWEA